MRVATHRRKKAHINFLVQDALEKLVEKSLKCSDLPSRRLSRTDLLSGSGADDSFRDFLKSKISSN